eukprot:3083416-Amphidinium_carterae.1
MVGNCYSTVAATRSYAEHGKCSPSFRRVPCHCDASGSGTGTGRQSLERQQVCRSTTCGQYDGGLRRRRVHP